MGARADPIIQPTINNQGIMCSPSATRNPTPLPLRLQLVNLDCRHSIGG
jgi:hypothetical protein